MDLKDLKATYKVLSEIMKDDHLTKDTSFVRVRSYISNKICDTLIKEDENTRNC